MDSNEEEIYMTNTNKQLLLGNKAVARGLYEAGVCFISSYPGTPSTEVTEEAVKFDDIDCEWAPLAPVWPAAVLSARRNT